MFRHLLLLIALLCLAVVAMAARPFSLRIHCGASTDYTDVAGKVWLADRDYQTGAWGAVRGGTVVRAEHAVAHTADAALYLSERYGAEAYRILVPNGRYIVTLAFCETYEGTTQPGQRVFSVAMGRTTVLANFDPFHAAGDQRFVPVVRSFNVRVQAGEIYIGFHPSVGTPEINAIQVAPSGVTAPDARWSDGDNSLNPREAFNLRIRCGASTDYTDAEGNRWQADREYIPGSWGAEFGGTDTRAPHEVKDTKDAALYLSERFGMFGYRLPVPRGRYQVTLHFCETFDGTTQPGQRVFSVALGATTVLQDLDPFHAAGDQRYVPVTRTFAVSAPHGEIYLSFREGQGVPEINGIEIVQVMRNAHGGQWIDATRPPAKPIASLPAGQPGTLRVYHVGNSLTFGVMGFGRAAEFLGSRGTKYEFGMHILWGSSLATILNSRNTSSVDPGKYGRFPQALADYPWDALTLQPYAAALEGGNGDIAAAEKFIELASAHHPAPQVFIYESWPTHDAAMSYAQKWERPYQPGMATPNLSCGAYCKLLVAALRKGQPKTAKPVLLIPVGSVLYELDKLMAAGKVPGYTGVADLYVPDGIHLNEVGYYVARCTYFAVLMTQDPRGLPPWISGGQISEDLARVIQQTVWKVVRSEGELTGVSDQ